MTGKIPNISHQYNHTNKARLLQTGGGPYPGNKKEGYAPSGHVAGVREKIRGWLR